jgi:CHAT domain-containing protein
VNGFLRLNEIYNLNLNADLVVLSACQTALGKEVRGEGLDRANSWVYVRGKSARGGESVEGR